MSLRSGIPLMQAHGHVQIRQSMTARVDRLVNFLGPATAWLGDANLMRVCGYSPFGQQWRRKKDLCKIKV
jgi:hypothetical protein